MYHRTVAVVLSGTLTLLNHAIECIILVVGIFVVCCLYTILREDQAGFIVVLVADACCTRQLLPTAFIERILILVLKSIFVQICFFLILGLKHIADSCYSCRTYKKAIESILSMAICIKNMR